MIYIVQAKKLLQKCDTDSVDKISKKINLNSSIQEIEQLSQISVEEVGFSVADEKGKYK